MDLLIKAQSVRIKELKAELYYWTNQYGCQCEHPSCSVCEDTKSTKALLTKDEINTV